MTTSQDGRLYKPFDANLRAILREFRRCAEMYWPLYHEQLTGGFNPDGQVINVSEIQWQRFIEANSDGEDSRNEDWQHWDSTAIGLGRFFGSPDGLSEFQDLAESACIVLNEMDLDLEGVNSHVWLDLLHTTGFRQRLPLLRSDLTMWGLENYSSEEFYELCQQWSITSDGTRSFPLHPLRYTLVHSVFVSSVALIEAILDPDTVLLISSSLDKDHFAHWLFPPRRLPDEALEKANEQGSYEQSSELGNNWIKRTGSNAWKVRYIEDGVVEEHEFSKHEGFYIYQQLLTSDGKTILNKDLGNPANKPHFKEGDSVMSEADMVASVGGNAESLEGKFWDSHVEQDDVVSEETIEWLKAEAKRKSDLLDTAELEEDAEAVRQLRNELNELRALFKQSVDRRGRSRKIATGNEKEQHRSRVAKALSECRKRIKPKMPRFHDFLRKNVRPQSGVGMSYLLGHKVTWDS